MCNSTDQWRIQDFLWGNTPHRGVPTPDVATFHKICMSKWKNRYPKGACAGCVPLGSATADCVATEIFQSVVHGSRLLADIVNMLNCNVIGGKHYCWNKDHGPVLWGSDIVHLYLRPGLHVWYVQKFIVCWKWTLWWVAWKTGTMHFLCPL